MSTERSYLCGAVRRVAFTILELTDDEGEEVGGHRLRHLILVGDPTVRPTTHRTHTSREGQCKWKGKGKGERQGKGG